MSTTMVRTEDVQRKWYVLDAAGKPLGKTAALAADLLRGKRKVDYTPHVDGGDFVIIVNCKDAVLTGNKLTQKYYRTHSGYAGGLKETRYDRLMATRPTLAMTLVNTGYESALFFQIEHPDHSRGTLILCPEMHTMHIWQDEEHCAAFFLVRLICEAEKDAQM